MQLKILRSKEEASRVIFVDRVEDTYQSLCQIAFKEYNIPVD
jgi:hypothetical protein